MSRNLYVDKMLICVLKDLNVRIISTLHIPFSIIFLDTRYAFSLIKKHSIPAETEFTSLLYHSFAMGFGNA